MDRVEMKNNMRLTKRDLDLIQWMNSVGFVTIDLIVQYLKMSKATAYRRLHKLVSHGYLLHEWIFHGVAGIYRASLLGAQVSGSELPPLRCVNKATYHHDLTVTALSFRLLDHFGGRYVPERILRQRDGQEVFGKTGHISDGILELGDKNIAIEVELHKKGKHRREKILKEYLKNFNYQAVWYFCGNQEVERQLEPLTKSFDFLKVYPLSDYLSGELMS